MRFAEEERVEIPNYIGCKLGHVDLKFYNKAGRKMKYKIYIIVSFNLIGVKWDVD